MSNDWRRASRALSSKKAVFEIAQMIRPEVIEENGDAGQFGKKLKVKRMIRTQTSESACVTIESLKTVLHRE